MKLHRFIGDYNLKDGQTIKISDPDFFNQAKNVLKLRAGEKIVLSDGNLNEAVAELLSFDGEAVEVRLQQVSQNPNEPKNKVILYCSVLKRENFEMVAQKATEIGVSEIVPIICRRTVKTGLKTERLEKIIKEAAEQSGRGIVPVLRQPLEFEKAIQSAEQNVANLFFDISGEPFALSICEIDRVGIFIGPEGGWEPPEIELAKENGLKIASLGKLTLRAETAAIVASYIACGNCGLRN